MFDTINDTINDTLNDTLNDSINDDESMLLSVINNKPEATRKELSKLVGKSETTIHRIIVSLINKKLIIRKGSKKTGYWIVLKGQDSN